MLDMQLSRMGLHKAAQYGLQQGMVLEPQWHTTTQNLQITPPSFGDKTKGS